MRFKQLLDRPATTAAVFVFSIFLGVFAASEASVASEAGFAANPGDLRPIIANAKSQVFPSVVFLMPIAERYDAGKMEKAQVAGSGVIISPDGEFITNWHVVDKAVDIRCLLYDGTVAKANIVGTDKDTDLALLKLDAPGIRFPYAELADSGKLEEGQLVMAMGAPWGLSRSVSMGILSCVNRFLPGHGGGYNLWLQTDASINPGNSGGPLIDTEGRVVGINSLGFIFGGDLAFAIPSNTVKSVSESLRRDGRVKRAWTGLHLQPLKDFEKNIFYEGNQGVLVAGVDPNSPADQAGIEVGQMLLSVNGREVRGINHEDIPGINLLLSELPIGEPVNMELRTGLLHSSAGETRVSVVTPMEKGLVEGDDFDCRRWNMTIKAINEFATPMLHFFKPKGVYIQAVKHPGNAASAGLKKGDIIEAIDGEPVNDFETCKKIYERIVADENREKKVVFTVSRAGLKNFQVLDYAPRYGQD